MWLLYTPRAELHFFSEAAHVKGGYAVISHTWAHPEDEQDFQAVQEIRRECQLTGANPRDRVCSKIRMSCMLAEYHGYDWL